MYYIDSDDPKNYLVTGRFKICKEPLVNGRIIKRLTDNRYELAILIDENTTIEDVIKSWKGVKFARKYLLQEQGPEYIDYFSWRISSLKKDGVGYKKIAHLLNQAILIYICSYVIENRNGGPRGIFWRGEAYSILKSVMMKNEDINSWIQSAQETIEENKLPFPPNGGPINWMRIRDALRQWDKKYKELKVQMDPKTIYGGIQFTQPILISEFEVSPFYLPAINFYKGLENF